MWVGHLWPPRDIAHGMWTVSLQILPGTLVDRWTVDVFLFEQRELILVLGP